MLLINEYLAANAQYKKDNPYTLTVIIDGKTMPLVRVNFSTFDPTNSSTNFNWHIRKEEETCY